MDRSSEQTSSSSTSPPQEGNESARISNDVPHTVKVTVLELTGINYNCNWKDELRYQMPQNTQDEQNIKSLGEETQDSSVEGTYFPPGNSRAIVTVSRSNTHRLGISTLSNPLQLCHHHKISMSKSVATADEDVQIEIAAVDDTDDSDVLEYRALWDYCKNDENQNYPIISFDTTLLKSADPSTKDSSATSSKATFAPKSFQVMVGLTPDHDKNIALPIGMATLTIKGNELPKVKNGMVINKILELPLLSLEQTTPQFGLPGIGHPKNDNSDLIHFGTAKPHQKTETAVEPESLETTPEKKKKKVSFLKGVFSKKSKKTKESKNNEDALKIGSSQILLDRKSFTSQYNVNSEGTGILRVAIEVYDKTTNDEKRIQFQRLKEKIAKESAQSKNNPVQTYSNDESEIQGKKITESLSVAQSTLSTQTSKTTNVSLVGNSDLLGEYPNGGYNHDIDTISYDINAIATVASGFTVGSATQCTNASNETYSTSRTDDGDSFVSEERSRATVVKGSQNKMGKMQKLLSCGAMNDTRCGNVGEVDTIIGSIANDHQNSIMRTSDSPQGVEEVNGVQERLGKMFSCGQLDGDEDQYYENDFVCPPSELKHIRTWESGGTMLTEASGYTLTTVEKEYQEKRKKRQERQMKREEIRKEVENANGYMMSLPTAFGGQGLFFRLPKAMTHEERDERDRLAEKALQEVTGRGLSFDESTINGSTIDGSTIDGSTIDGSLH